MGRALGLLLALLVLLGGATALSCSSAVAAPADGGSLQINITAPLSSPIQYLQTSYANVTWEWYDPLDNITGFEVKLDTYSWISIPLQSWYNFTGLSDDTHYVTVRGITTIPGEGPEDSVTFYINSVPPALRITNPDSGDYLNTSAVTVTWQGSSGVGIKNYEIQLDSNPSLTSLGSSQTSNTFSSIPNGHHNVTVIAHDWGGRTSTAVVAFSVDTTVPTLAITSPSNGKGFNHADVTVEWNGSDAGHNLIGYQIWLDGVKLTTAVPGENHVSSIFGQGYHTVKIVAMDMANSTASDQVTFLVDTVVPSITDHSPEGTDMLVSTVVEVNFSKEMDREATDIAVAGVDGSTEWDGNSLRFTPFSPLSYGATYAVVVNASDLVGNEVSSSWTFTTTNLGTISGVVTDGEGKPVAGVTVTLDNGASTTTDSSGAFSLTAPAGAHNLTVSKLGWDSATMSVEIKAGQSVSLETMPVKPSNPLALYGVIAAVAAVLLALLFYTFRRRRYAGHAPPARSWKGMEDLERRSRQHRDEYEDDEDERL